MLSSLILKFAKMATPFTAGTSFVPFRFAPPSKLPACSILIEMVPAKLVTRLFWASKASTRTGGEIVAPGAVLVGRRTDRRFVAGAGSSGGGAAGGDHGGRVHPTD